MGGLDAVVFFFVFGMLAGLARADLRLPQAVYEFASTLLLLSIGIKGGVELAGRPVLPILGPAVIVVAFGGLLTLVAFALLRGVGRLGRPDAASIAAHYGCVSAGTFAVGVAYVGRVGLPYDPELPLYLVLLEIPAIVCGILLARGFSAGTPWGEVLKEVFLGRSVLLLIGGLVIGAAGGKSGVAPIAPLFIDLFKGVLAIFLLEMGLIAANHIGGFRRHGAFLVAFAVLVPIAFGAAGAGLGRLLGLEPGGALLLALLAASASYIAAPAAMRTAVPEANPALSLTAALAITFPFNILLGLPLYHRMVDAVYA